MPRRGTEAVQPPEPPKKKLKVVQEQLSLLCPSLDVSFTDDEALPPGIVFSDIQQKKWRIGKPIGRGSFGRIYLASDNVDKDVTKLNANYVVKIEPHTNGPLFVEVHCLVRTSQVSKIKAWRQQNKQKHIGMPVYIASGSFTDEKTGTKYRFLVLPRYDIDLQKVIARTKVLDLKNVLVLALQILDVLEYLHNQGYTHSDIKSSNLMLGFENGKINKYPMAKASSFQKETKELPVLSGKQRRVKSGKARSSNYYDDEDFIIKDSKTDSDGCDNEKRLDNVKAKLRKILSDRDNRTLHRHHAFNLRQLSSYVNYEDMTSSVCSDQSYQKLLDDFGNKSIIRTTAEFYQDTKRKQPKANSEDLDEIHREAILLQSNKQIYLLDYGLASKFLDSEGRHKDFGMDARKAHDGTLEYSSRDSHIGAHSRRSDLETLGYNLIDWLTGSLPWKTSEVLAEPDLVHALKKNYMSDIKSFLKTSFKTELYPQCLEKYLEYVTNLNFTQKPDYDYCRSLFKNELMKNTDKEVSLKLAEPPNSPIGRKLCKYSRFGRKNTPIDFLIRNGVKKSYERENVCSLENDLKLELLKQSINISSEGIRKPCTSRNFFVSDADLVARLKKSLMPHDVLGKKLSPKNLRSNKKVQNQKRRGKRTHRNSIGKFGNFMGSAKQFTWAEILAQNPEDILRKERNVSNNDDEEDDDETCKYRIRKLSTSSSESSDSNIQSPLRQKDYLQGLRLTYAMKEVLANFKKKVSNKGSKEQDEIPEELKGYTPAMVKIHRIKEKREALEREALKAQAEVKETPAQSRCTRSMRSKKTEKKIEVPATTTRKTKTNSTDIVRKTKVNSADIVKVKEVSVCVEKLNINNRCKTKNVKSPVTIEESPKSKTTTKTKKSTRSTAVPNNRRRLRSSKRKA